MTIIARNLIVASVGLLSLALAVRAEAQGYRALTAVPYADRGVDLFAIDSDDSVEHRYQREPGGDFAGFEELGGTATDIAALELPDGRYEVFIVDRNQALWHSHQPPDSYDWTAWEQLDNSTKQVSVARAASGRMELFVLDGEDVLWHIGRDSDDAGFGAWQQLDLHGTQLSATAADGGEFELAVIDTDRTLWQLSFSDAGELLSDPTNLAGESFDVAYARIPAGGYSLITVGTDNQLWEGRRAADQDFGDWQSLGRAAARITLTGSSEGLQLFTLGDTGELTRAQLTAADSSWSEPQVIVEASPLVSQLQGRARLIIPSLDVDKDVAVSIELRFSVDRSRVDITSFPSVVTEPFDTPLGSTTSTVSLTRSSTGELRRDDGSLILPVTLHFDQSLDLPIFEEDADLSVDLSSDAADGQRLDPATGEVTLSGTGRFDGQGASNPLDGQDAQIILSGKLTPTP